MKTPYRHQIESAKSLLAHKRFGLFHDCGVGKTFTSMYALSQIKSGAIVIGPSSARLTWEKENEEFSLPLRYFNYTSFQKLTKEDVLGKVVICDECHFLKSANSQRSRKALELFGYPNNIQHLWLLTGTPIADTPTDLFMLLVLLGKRSVEDFWKFRATYCKLKKKQLWKYNYLKHKKEVWKTFYEIVGFKNLALLRRECADVSSYLKLAQCIDLPPATFVPYHYDLSKKERQEYQEVMGDHVQHLLQWASKVSYQKVVDLVQQIREESGGKVVVFSNFIRTVKDLSQLLDNSPYLIGGMDSDGIKEQVDRFYGDSDVLLCTYKTGGVSLNLQNATYCILVDLPYYLLEYKQSLGRIYRAGQTSKTFFYLLLPKKTILEEVFELLNRKFKFTTDVFPEEKDFDILRYLEEVRLHEKNKFVQEGDTKSKEGNAGQT